MTPPTGHQKATTCDNLPSLDAARGDEVRSAFALRVLMERAERGGKGGGS